MPLWRESHFVQQLPTLQAWTGRLYHESRANDSRISPLPRAGEGSGGETGNSRSMLRAH
ncbi:hypothetical protein ACCAA_760035 [Candidatus Accumulibacter aalborgensis]|uniref:Uncharacterized protein n=1 Tax=Candidatus Accumulibacter aalborgensis TaxID=1860102 RepID=A0A1A8XXQ4_9PROT|nr:hypothetical protein ACCAA_760035 [Candidatus Accumulibacter aalborgensis]